MRVLRSAGYRRMPWKNGGGETAEIVVSPAGAGLDAFDWRVSMARVIADGPFSIFSGVDRTLTILDGKGLLLSVGGNPPIELTTMSPPLAFAGDAATSARLIDGPVTDLNVMARRGRVVHSVTRHTFDQASTLAIDAAAAVLLCIGGAARVATPDGQAELTRLDALAHEDHPRELWQIAADAPATVVLIQIRSTEV